MTTPLSKFRGHICFSCSEKLNLVLDIPARVATAKCCHCKKVKSGASLKFYKEEKQDEN